MHGLLVTHGGLGAELIRTVRGILGKDGGLRAFTNEDCSTSTLRDRIARAVPGDGLPIFIFVDLPGGSCETAALGASLAGHAVSVLTGTNLAMIVEFAQNAGNHPVEVLRDRILERGKRTIVGRPLRAAGA